MGNLIRTRNKSQAPLTKYMGAFMPLRIFTSIVLYGLAKGINKTTVMEQIFNVWLAETFNAELEKECIKQIANNLNVRYEELRLSHRSLTYSMFCEDVKKEFEIKGLYFTSIKSILNELDIIHFK